MLPVQNSSCHAMCLRLERLESNSFNPHDVISLFIGEVLCVVSSPASVKCSGGWERDWGYCLGAVRDAVILAFCFLLFRAKARSDKQAMEGLGWPEEPWAWMRSLETVTHYRNCRAVMTFLYLCVPGYSLGINCELEADAIKSYELLIASWRIPQTAKRVFLSLARSISGVPWKYLSSSFSFFLLVTKFLWNLY